MLLCPWLVEKVSFQCRLEKVVKTKGLAMEISHQSFLYLSCKTNTPYSHSLIFIIVFLSYFTFITNLLYSLLPNNSLVIDILFIKSKKFKFKLYSFFSWCMKEKTRTLTKIRSNINIHPHEPKMILQNNTHGWGHI